MLSNWSEISENYPIAAAAWLVADAHQKSAGTQAKR
jgi:hypothetical protein